MERTAQQNLIELLAVFKENKTLLSKALATSPRSIGRWINGYHPIPEEKATVIENMLEQYLPELFSETLVFGGPEIENIIDIPAPSPDTVVENRCEPRMVLLVEGYVQGEYILTIASSVTSDGDALTVFGEDGCAIIMSQLDNNVSISRVPHTHDRVQYYYNVQQSFSQDYAMWEIGGSWNLKTDISAEDIVKLRSGDIGVNKLVILSKLVTDLYLG